MEKSDILIIIFLLILVVGLLFLYLNLSSFECSMESMFSDVMSDVSYSFEPEGSVYSKTKIFRFAITSSRNRFEYFGMSITKDGISLFFDNRTEPGGGSIVATLSL